MCLILTIQDAIFNQYTNFTDAANNAFKNIFKDNKKVNNV